MATAAAAAVGWYEGDSGGSGSGSGGISHAYDTSTVYNVSCRALYGGHRRRRRCRPHTTPGCKIAMLFIAVEFPLACASLACYRC